MPCNNCNSYSELTGCRHNKINPATEKGTASSLKAGYKVCSKNIWIKTTLLPRATARN